MDDLEPEPEAAAGAGYDRIAASAVAAGVLLFGGTLYGTFVLLGKLPRVGLIQGLSPALHGQVAAPVDPRSARVLYTDHHAVSLILDSLIVALATVAMIAPLRLLYDAAVSRLEGARAKAAEGTRMPRVPRSALWVLLLGAGGGAVVLLGAQSFDVLRAHDFATHADRGRSAVDKALGSTPGVILTSVGVICQLSLAAAFVMIPLGAMRAGLVTRLMGYVAIVSGGLSWFLWPLQIIQAFWLIALGVQLSGRASAPLPPAWAAGVAMPWPPQQSRRPRPPPVDEPALATPAPRVPRNPSPHASKKRKKRR